MMQIEFSSAPPPMRQDEHGAIRVGNSRVLLELVIEEFENGATPETIIQAYDTLRLADVYLVLGYYLNHRQQIAEYLAAREDQATKVRERIEREQPDIVHIRERLARLRSEGATENAQVGK